MREAEKMGKEKVIELLLLFPEIDEEIRTYRNILEELEGYYNHVPGMNLDGMPKGKNHFKSQTEKSAMNIPDYVKKEIRDYEKKIHNLRKVKVEIIKEISRLSLLHKNIVFGFYFNKLKWEEVATKTHYSQRQCKNIRDAAVEILVERFENNKVLSNYKIKE